MVKCPICKENITNLNNVQSGENIWKFDGEKYEELKDQSFFPDNQVDNFECPECGAVLANKEEDAIKFLNGE